MELKELVHARTLIEKGKFEEALLVLKEFEEENNLTSEDRFSCFYLQAYILTRFGDYEEGLKVSKKAYEESLVLEDPLASIDTSFFMVSSIGMLGDFEKAYNMLLKCEVTLKSLSNLSILEREKREAYIAHQKSYFVRLEGDATRALEYANKSLELREKIGDKFQIVESLASIGEYHALITCDLDQALKFMVRCQELAIEINHPFCKSNNLNTLGIIYSLKGETEVSLSYFEEAIPYLEKFNNKVMLAAVLNNLGDAYCRLGNFEQSLKYLEKSLNLAKESEVSWPISSAISTTIEVLLSKGDSQEAQKYLEQLKELSEKENTRLIIEKYKLHEAMVLKSSPRIHDKAKAEEMLKKMIQQGMLRAEGTIYALLNLCELLLDELRVTEEIEILEEINPLIDQLLNIAKGSNSFWILAETYILQANLALISSDLGSARRGLTQAQELAEQHGMHRLATKISLQHDELLEQLKIWEGLMKTKSTIAKRFELSQLDKQMTRMVMKSAIEISNVDVEQPILLIIITKEGNLLLSNQFTADLIIDEHGFSELLASFNLFINQIFSEKFDRVKFGQYKILIKEINSIYICYMFQGQSYSAQQKITYFSERLSKNSTILRVLNKSRDSKNLVKISENPGLEELILESFLSDPKQFQVPFKAYTGTEAYLFVSYAHADKLHVYPIIDYLNKKKINIWYDEGIPISENWKKSIVTNLERCHAFLVFISPNIIQSENVRKEISFALKKHKKFFSIHLKETNLPSELEYDIGDIQHMKKYLMSETKFYTELLDIIKF
ncbi:MAG: tetratricopeptide repeat protein [Candidatus Hermodarchaeota archaeon]